MGGDTIGGGGGGCGGPGDRAHIYIYIYSEQRICWVLISGAGDW